MFDQSDDCCKPESTIHSGPNDDPMAWAQQIEREIEEGCRRAADLVREHKRKSWHDWAGASLDEMLVCREVTVRNLGSDNPLLRKTAISLLLDHWHCAPEFAATLHHLAVEDRDPDVREIALLVLGSAYHGSRNHDFARFLSELVSDERMPVKVRMCAYNLLFQVEGMHRSSWPTLLVFRGSFKFPGDVDWHFVNRFRLETRA